MLGPTPALPLLLRQMHRVRRRENDVGGVADEPVEPDRKQPATLASYQDRHQNPQTRDRCPLTDLRPYQ